MKWIVLAILVFVVGYTAVNLRYRRSGKASEPYHDAKIQATTTRLLSAGFRRIKATASRPADVPRPPAFSLDLAPPSESPGGIPEQLAEGLIDKPVLAHSYGGIIAPRDASPAAPYSFQFTCLLPDHKTLFADAHAYLKDNELAVVTNFDRLDGDLNARTKDTTVIVTIPADTLAPGTYRVTLIGERQSKSWTLQVN